MKLLIVLVAVCIVSTQAFVRREAPAAAAADDFNLAKTLQAELEKGLKSLEGVNKEFAKTASSLADQALAVLKSDDLKKNIDDGLKKAQGALDEVKKAIDKAPKA